MGIRQRWRAQMEHWRFRFGPRAAEWLIGLSTWAARARLGSDPITVLIDNNVLGHAVTHETTWIDTGTKKWGGTIDVPTGYAARIPVYASDNTSREYANIKYLPGIARLARDGYVRLCTSAELGDEQFRQPMGRFRGYGSFDYSIFRDIQIESLDGVVLPEMGPEYLNLPSAREQQQGRIARAADPLYEALVKRLGKRNNLDAWHIRTAERHGAYCFLTMDFRLRKAVADQSHLEPFRSLRTRVMTPLEFGKAFGLKPIDPVVLSYNDASYFVRADLFWAEGKRRPLRHYQRRSRV